MKKKMISVFLNQVATYNATNDDGEWNIMLGMRTMLEIVGVDVEFGYDKEKVDTVWIDDIKYIYTLNRMVAVV